MMLFQQKSTAIFSCTLFGCFFTNVVKRNVKWSIVFLPRRFIMPKRPRSHEIEEFSRGRLRDLFGRLGWVVWDLHPDYGEDLLVRIFTNGAATHYSFFVQAKATDHIDR